MLLWTGGIRLQVMGKSHLPQYPHSPSIVVMNHSSALDIYVLESIIGSYPHVWMSKASYKKIPLFNILLSRMHVTVERENPRKALQAVAAMSALLQKYTTHGLLYPEGRRYSDGEIHDFFVGFALLAQKLKRPVIPVAVWGLHLIYPKETFIVDSSATTVKVCIGEPIHYHADESVEDFTKRVRSWYLDTLTSLRTSP